MKNLILVLAFILAAPVSGWAQETSSGLQLGLVAGASRSFLSGNDVAESSNGVTKPVAGLSMKCQLAPFFISTGLFFETKGSSKDSEMYLADESGMNYTTQQITVKVNYHYLVIPVLIGGRINETGFFINAGPYAGLFLKSNASADHLEDWDFDSSTRRVDFGLAGGVGYEKSIASNLTFSVEARHNLGLLDNRKSAASSEGANRMNSTNLLFGLHYTLAK